MEFRNQYTPSPPELRQNANNRTMWFAQYGRDGTFTVKTKRANDGWPPGSAEEDIEWRIAPGSAPIL